MPIQFELLGIECPAAHGSLHLFRYFMHLRAVISIVVALDILLDILHFFALPLPLGFAHFTFPAKQFLVWLPVGAAQSIPQREELAIVVVEIEMMHCVACRTVDYRRISYIFPVICTESCQRKVIHS